MSDDDDDDLIQHGLKGNADTPDCVFHNAHNVTIDLTKCNIRRKREVNPSGVAYQLVVVVQLHKVTL